MSKRTRDSKRIPKKVATRRRVADASKRITVTRLAGWVGTAFSVISFIEQVRDLLTNDVPTLARHALRQLGLSYSPTDELTIQGFTQVVARDTGIPFRDFSDIEKTKQDIFGFALAEINEATGLNITRLDDPDYVRGAIFERVIDAARGAAPNAMMSLRFAGLMRKAARDAFRDGYTNQLGAPFTERVYRWNHREAVRTYGQSHIQEWSFDDLCRKRKVYGRYKVQWREKQVRKEWRRNNFVWRKIIKGLALGQGEFINYLNSPGEPGITPHHAPEFVGFTELQRLRKRNNLKPLHRRKSHPWQFVDRDDAFKKVR